jgi:alkylhydroperoxidase family enzyme
LARIPYPDYASPEVRPLVERIKRERGGKMLNLYRMLMHSPPFAEGWLTFFTAVRQKGVLSGRHRELAIMRIAVINGADYEFMQHVPFALKEGLTQPQLDALRAGRDPEGVTDADRAVLAYTDAMTRNVRVSDDVFAQVRRAFGDRALVELTVTVAGYNCVSRFLEAIQVDHE